MSAKDKKLIDAILDFDEDEVIETINQMKSSGTKPLEIMEVCRKAMDQVGKMFKEKQIFLTELIMAGELLKTIMAEIGLTADKLAVESGQSKGKILIGTVEGDIHDIGKNIVSSLLISNGYQVIDIGEDVPPAKFVEEIKKHKPQIVALTGLLTLAYDSMKNTIDAFAKDGIRKQIKVMVGGGATDKQVCEYVGADGFGTSAVDAVKLAKEWIKE